MVVLRNDDNVPPFDVHIQADVDGAADALATFASILPSMGRAIESAGRAFGRAFPPRTPGDTRGGATEEAP